MKGFLSSSSGSRLLLLSSVNVLSLGIGILGRTIGRAFEALGDDVFDFEGLYFLRVSSTALISSPFSRHLSSCDFNVSRTYAS